MDALRVDGREDALHGDLRSVVAALRPKRGSVQAPNGHLVNAIRATERALPSSSIRGRVS
jgi:hypothetical protein